MDIIKVVCKKFEKTVIYLKNLSYLFLQPEELFRYVMPCKASKLYSSISNNKKHVYQMNKK